MVTAEHFYIGVNVILGLVCLVSIFLAFTSVPANGGRNLLIVALVLFIVSGAGLAVIQHFFRMYALAYMGDLSGVTKGAFQQVDQIRQFLPLAEILEVAAVALCVLVGKRLVLLAAGEAGTQPKGGAE
jgi:hypothetical protein